MRVLDWDIVIIITVAVIGFCAICFFMKSCSVQNNESDNAAMVKMVSEGADPIAARCAVIGSAAQECSVYTALKSKSVKE